MLNELHVRNLALIEEAWLEFGPGMTVLTGETGAGKTALLGALKLLLGERADSGSVRAGAREAQVEGAFGVEGAEVLAARRITADGRSHCRIDGEMASVGTLAERLGPLVDLHGQHEHQALLSPATHVGYLDRWAGPSAREARSRYADARDAWAAAVSVRDALEARIAAGERDADYLRFVLAEIEAVSPSEQEDDELEARLPALQHGERLAEAAEAVAAVLRGDGGALDRVAEAQGLLGRVAGIDPALDAVSERLSEAAAIIDDAGTSAREYRDRIEHDPYVLEEVLTRLALLSGLKKKYGPDLAAVLRRRDEARLALDQVADSTRARREAEEAVSSAEEALRLAAAALSGVRRDAAPGFVAALGEAAADLAMGSSSFDVDFRELEFSAWTSEGSERIEFLYSGAPGTPHRALARIASGGEISRVMLALKGVLGEADSVETLVFDEIDAGIGGETAHAVGRRLAELSQTHQVVVVTHLAQVAAYADEQLVVRKEIGADSATTVVVRVEGDERTREIARMLSGNTSDASIAHAHELLRGAKRGAVA